MGAPPFELQGRPRDKPITANARTKTANARPLNPFASNKRMAARASHTSSPFPRHHLASERLKTVELAGFDCQLDAPRNLIAHLIGYTVVAGAASESCQTLPSHLPCSG